MRHPPAVLHRFSITILMTLGACCALAAETPPFQPYQATYAVTRGNSEIGQVEVELSRREAAAILCRSAAVFSATY